MKYRSQLNWPVLLAAVLVIATDCPAQKQSLDENTGFGIFASQEEYRQFIGSAKKVAYGPNGNKELQAMIPLLNDIALNKPIGTTAGKFKGQPSSFGLLTDKSIRDEIEMVDQQYDELQQANERIEKWVAQEVRGLDFSNPLTATTRIRGIRNRATRELEELLLPHQVKRLQQLHLQSRLQRNNLIDLLTQDPFKEELEISSEQADQLREESTQIQKDLEEQIQRLRKEAREKLLGKLKPEQQKKAKDLLGREFGFGIGEQGRKGVQSKKGEKQ